MLAEAWHYVARSFSKRSYGREVYRIKPYAKWYKTKGKAPLVGAVLAHARNAVQAMPASVRKAPPHRKHHARRFGTPKALSLPGMSLPNGSKGGWHHSTQLMFEDMRTTYVRAFLKSNY